MRRQTGKPHQKLVAERCKTAGQNTPVTITNQVAPCDPPGSEIFANANSLLRGRLLAGYAGLRRYSLQFVQVKALFERWEHPVSDELPHGRSRYRHHGCRCTMCVETNRLYMRELRARKRGLTPVPAVRRPQLLKQRAPW